MDELRERNITHLTCDSRTAGPHSAFVCIEGQNADGHAYAGAAYRNGCRMFVCRHPLDLPSDAFQQVVDDPRIALAELSASFYGNAAQRLHIIGVTGTKGKSTVATMIRSVFLHAGIQTDIIGTIGMTVGGVFSHTVNSTPESIILHESFARMEQAGTTHVVMEVSSQAYKLHRVHGITFDCGVYTNLAPDHIGPGEHESFEDYRNCKSRLFENARFAVLNADDAYSGFMQEHCRGNSVTYGVDGDADYRAENIELITDNGVPGVSFYLDGQRFTIQLPGTFNVYNALAAVAVADRFGISRRICAEALAKCTVTGRCQRVDCLPGVSFFIDYSHNGLALQNALGALRAYRPKRLICLFGSVGDRTQMRRRELGEAAGSMCDFCILTSDNPGHEAPEKIIAEIERYVGDCPHICITDREEAIRWAVRHARQGDLILFAGKGHEDYQLIGSEHVPFSEESIIRDEAAKLTAQRV